MVKLIGLLKRKSGFSVEDFRAYYENNHAPLIECLLPAGDDYRRNYPTLVLVDGKEVDGEPEFDVIVEMWFENHTAYELFVKAMQNPDIGPVIAKDEEQFIDRSLTRIMFVNELRSHPSQVGPNVGGTELR